MTEALLKKLPSQGLCLLRLLEDIASWGVPLLLFVGCLPLPKDVWEEARYGFWGIGIAIVLLLHY